MTLVVINDQTEVKREINPVVFEEDIVYLLVGRHDCVFDVRHVDDCAVVINEVDIGVFIAT